TVSQPKEKADKHVTLQSGEAGALASKPTRQPICYPGGHPWRGASIEDGQLRVIPDVRFHNEALVAGILERAAPFGRRGDLTAVDADRAAEPGVLPQRFDEHLFRLFRAEIGPVVVEIAPDQDHALELRGVSVLEDHVVDAVPQRVVHPAAPG